jgi:hypothetical protein
VLFYNWQEQNLDSVHLEDDNDSINMLVPCGQVFGYTGPNHPACTSPIIRLDRSFVQRVLHELGQRWTQSSGNPGTFECSKSEMAISSVEAREETAQPRG